MSKVQHTFMSHSAAKKPVCISGNGSTFAFCSSLQNTVRSEDLKYSASTVATVVDIWSVLAHVRVGHKGCGRRMGIGASRTLYDASAV